MPAGSLAKASLVGAKTVNGPGEESVSTRPAALTAATRVVWMGELIAFCTMVLLAYMGAPPTSGSFWAEAVRVVAARRPAARVPKRAFLRFIMCVVLLCFACSLHRPCIRRSNSNYAAQLRVDCAYLSLDEK